MEKQLNELLNKIIEIFKVLNKFSDRLVESVYTKLRDQHKSLSYIDYTNDLYKCIDIYDDVIGVLNMVNIIRYVNEYNDLIYKRELQKNENLRKITDKMNDEHYIKKNEHAKKDDCSIQKSDVIIPNKSIIKDADYCYNLILECKSDLKLVQDLLIDTEHENKDLICKRVLLKIKMDVNQITKLLNDKDLICSDDEREQLFDEIYSLNELSNFLNNNGCYNKKDELISKKRLIFPASESGKILLLTDIEKIPREYYLSFLLLIESIENNKPLNFKRFHNSELMRGFMEVRGHATRITYSNVLDNSVLSKCYLKKCDWNSVSQNTVINAAVDSKNYIDRIRTIFANDGYLKSFYEEQDEINKEIKSYLKERAR